MIFVLESRKIFEVENFGVLQKFLALRDSLMWCWIFKLVKKTDFFFEKVALFFLPPEGPGARNLCQATLVSMLLKNNNSYRNRQQIMLLPSHPFSRNFWMNLSRKKGFLGGASHFVWKTWFLQQNTNVLGNQFQDSSTFLGGATLSFSRSGKDHIAKIFFHALCG